MYDRAFEASTEMVEMAIRDLDDYLALFPDGLRPTVGHRIQAQEVRDSSRRTFCLGRGFANANVVLRWFRGRGGIDYNES